MKNHIQSLALVLIVLSLLGCGGGGSSGAELQSKTISISGKVIDGYIKDAYVCLDLNANGICEESEANTTSSPDGSYSFPDVKINTIVDMLCIISKGGFDIASEQEYKGELKNILDLSSTKDGSSTTLVLTPFSDLLASSYISSKDKTQTSDLKNKITTVFSITSLESNAMEDKSFFVKTQELEHIKNILDVIILKRENSTLSEEDIRVYKNKIKYSIIKTINKSQNFLLVIADIITSIEEDFNITITENEKNYIKNQISKTKEILASLDSNNSIRNSELSNIQFVLNTELKNSYEKLKNANINSVLEIDDLSSVRKEIFKDMLKLSSPNKTYSTPPFVPSFE